MVDVLCTLMGLLDIIAGIIIIVMLISSNLAIILGVLMIVKGVFSLGLNKLF